MIAAPGATCGAPKRGWNGWSKPSRPQEGRANAAMPRERAKSSPRRGASWRCDEHACAKAEKRILRKTCSGALRRSEFVSRASMSSTCSGRQLATTASSRCWRPGARSAGTWLNRGHARSGYPWKGHRPALPRSRSKRHIQAGELAASGFPGMLRKRGRGESMPKRGKTGLVSTVSAPFLRPPFRIGKLAAAWAVTGSSIQGEHLLGRWWKTQNVTQRPHCAES
jgi:hypothetical protein